LGFAVFKAAERLVNVVSSKTHVMETLSMFCQMCAQRAVAERLHQLQVAVPRTFLPNEVDKTDTHIVKDLVLVNRQAQSRHELTRCSGGIWYKDADVVNPVHPNGRPAHYLWDHW
jgi:hypothetical protein